jgi:hypothetical protein
VEREIGKERETEDNSCTTHGAKENGSSEQGQTSKHTMLFVGTMQMEMKANILNICLFLFILIKQNIMKYFSTAIERVIFSMPKLLC